MRKQQRTTTLTTIVWACILLSVTVMNFHSQPLIYNWRWWKNERWAWIAWKKLWSNSLFSNCSKHEEVVKLRIYSIRALHVSAASFLQTKWIYGDYISSEACIVMLKATQDVVQQRHSHRKWFCRAVVKIIHARMVANQLIKYTINDIRSLFVMTRIPILSWLD